MKRIALMATNVAVLVPLALFAAAATAQGSQTRSHTAMAEREEFSRSFRLAPGAQVRVEGIAGPVTVVTGGGAVARVHVVRSAATRRELQCYRTEVTGSSGRLVIRHVQFSRLPGCNSIRSSQEVRLLVPRSVDLSLSTIAGDVAIGPLDGALRLDSIAGHVQARGVRSGNLSSLASGLSLTLGHLHPRGVHVSAVVGRTEINFRRGTNADVSISTVQGNITSSTTGLPVRREHGDANLRIGAGGPPVSISAVVGDVELNRSS